jgi:hypothetical protein
MVMNAVRHTLYNNQRGFCHYCNIKMTKGHKGPYHVTADHIRTKKEGGGDMIGNLVGACFECNNRRGSIRYEAFKEFTTLYGRENYVSVYRRISEEEIEKHKLMWAFIRSERLDLAWIAPSTYFGPRTTWHSPPNAELAKQPAVNLTPAILPLRRPYLQVCRNLLKDIRQKFTYDQRKEIIDEGIACEQNCNRKKDQQEEGLSSRGQRDMHSVDQQRDGYPTDHAGDKADNPSVSGPRWTVSPSYFGRELFG